MDKSEPDSEHANENKHMFDSISPEGPMMWESSHKGEKSPKAPAQPFSWMHFLAIVFPFLVFRHPTARLSISPSSRTGRFVAWLVGLTSQESRAENPLPRLVSMSFRFGLLLLGSLFAVYFIAYICFSFNSESTYPQMGTILYWWILARNFVIILAIHLTCLVILTPNHNRLAMLHFDMKKIDPHLAYIGLFHNIRKFSAFVMRRPFRIRWFTTYLSDSILLGLTYLLYVVTCILRAVDHSDSVGRVLSETLNVYKGGLITGFVIYTLEFDPKLAKTKSGIYKGILLFILAMNFADFFLFVGEKTSESSIARAFGAGAQLFITHSSVLITAIMGGHHNNAHISPDLPLKSLWKLAVWLVLCLVFLTYAIIKESFQGDPDWQHNWVPVSFPYVMWGINVFGGLACLLFAARYSFSKQETLQLVRLGEHSAAILDKSAEEITGSNHHAAEEDEQMDYDIMLIVITFVISGVYFAGEIAAFFAFGEYISMTYWLTSPLAPFGLAVLTATIWWRPPARSQFALYVALVLASWCLLSVEVTEDCHLSSDVPMCCEYPGIFDSNHHLEEPHNAPGCIGLIASDGTTCLASVIENADDQKIIPISFTAVVDTTRAFDIQILVNGTLVERVRQDSASLSLTTKTCREHAETFVIGGKTLSSEAGCFGNYMYSLAGESVDVCRKPENDCSFIVQTLNCALIASEPLQVALLTSKVQVGLAAEATLLAANRLVRDGEKAESTFYSLFKIVGMAALLECFFTLFGIILKLIFLSECRTARVHRRSVFLRRRTTVLFDVQDGTLIPTEDALKIEEEAN